MHQPRILDFSEFVQHVDRWNDLWTRSFTTQPTVTAEGICLWKDSFAADADFRALVVDDGQRWVAGLPLVSQRIFEVVPAWGLPVNCTVNSGDVLVDRAVRLDTALKPIVDGFRQLPHSFAIFDEIEHESSRWQALFKLLHESGKATSVSERFEVGVVDILHDWESYQRSWSSNHRSAVKRSMRKIESEGELCIDRIREPSDQELDQLLKECFDIEDRGWKGEVGTSVRKSDVLNAYYQREARMIRDLGMLDLWLLRFNDRMIAFEYCHFSKGTCFSHKISFDPEYKHFGPGRLLRFHQLRAYHQCPDARLLDTLGLLCRAKAKWATRTYKLGRCVAALRGGLSSTLVRGYQQWKPWLSKVRRAEPAARPARPGAARYLEFAGKA